MRPLVPVLISFILGISFAYHSEYGYGELYIYLAASALPSIFLFLIKKRFRPLAIAPVFFFLGMLFVLPYKYPELPPDHIYNIVHGMSQDELAYGKLGTALEGVVTSAGPGNKRTRVELKTSRILLGDKWRDTSGAALITIEGSGLEFKNGESIRVVARLREPWNYGNPGEFDYVESLKAKGILVTGYVKDERLITRLGPAPAQGIERFLGLAEPWRQLIRRSIDSSGTKNGESLKALIISDKAGISPETRAAFAKTGTAHIIVIAGLHVGIVALFAYKLFFYLLRLSERLILRIDIKKACMLATLLPAAIYGMLAGFPVSTRRAIIMLFALVLTYLMNRGKDLINVIALAALIILAINPYALRDVSFQLTIAAVFFIVYLVPKFEDLTSAWSVKKPLEEHGPVKKFLFAKVLPAFLVTLAATLGTSPILAYHFNQVSILGIAANLIAVPITGVIVPLMLLYALVLPLWAGLAGILLYPADLLFSVMLRMIETFASVPYSSIRVTTPTLLEIALYYSVIMLAVNIRKTPRLLYPLALALLVLVADYAYWSYYARRSKELRVTYISVGQGESELVEFPDGKTLLIDGGGVFSPDFDVGERVVAPFLWLKKISSLDYMALSHAQRDHMGGLKFLAQNFHVKQFWWNGDGELKSLGKALEASGTKIKVVDGSSGRLFEEGGVIVEALHPFAGLGLDQNNMCLVLKITYGRHSFLFTGDIGKPAEDELIKKNIHATVLKAPHHGSRYSSTPEFLRLVNPSVIVISAGRGNSFGFPHSETLGRYAATGATVLRTDRNGAVEVSTDGDHFDANVYLTGGAR